MGEVLILKAEAAREIALRVTAKQRAAEEAERVAWKKRVLEATGVLFDRLLAEVAAKIADAADHGRTETTISYDRRLYPPVILNSSDEGYDVIAADPTTVLNEIGLRLDGLGYHTENVKVEKIETGTPQWPTTTNRWSMTIHWSGP